MLFIIEQEFRKNQPSWLAQYTYIDQAHVPVIKLKCRLDNLQSKDGFKYPKLLEQLISVDIT